MNNYLVGRAFSRKLEEEADALGLEVKKMVSHLLAMHSQISFVLVAVYGQCRI
jgi:hypothetical protein